MKKALAFLLTLVMVLGLAACGSNGGSTSTPTEPAAQGQTQNQGESGTENPLATNNDESLVGTDYDNSVEIDNLTYITDTDISSLVPWDVRTLTPGIAYEVYEMLYGVDANGEYYAVLADATRGSYLPGMDHEAGSSDYTIYIYDYITDSAGHKITADDVKFSFDMARDGGFESGWGSFLSEEVIDDTTIVLHCERELNRMGELQNIICRTFIFSEDAYNESRSGLANDACGTGPYVVTNFIASTELTVTKRDDYWQTNEELRTQLQQANVKTITLSILGENTQKVIGIETGKISLAEKFGEDNMAQLAADGYKYNVYSTQNNMMVFVCCNCDPSNPCSNLALRKAILMAIDNDALAAFVGNGQVGCKTLGNNFYADYNPAWEYAYSLYQPADEEEIAALLKEANYNGEELQLLTATFCGEYAEVIQGLLAAYGINVNLNVLDPGTCFNLKSDPSQWDIFYQFMAADDYVVNFWSHMLDAEGRMSGVTENFIDDQHLQDLLHACMTLETHTDENLAAFLQYVDDNAYAKAMCMSNNNLIYPDNMTRVFKTDKGYIVPGACCFSN